MVVVPRDTSKVRQVQTLSFTERGAGGFGSTDVPLPLVCPPDDKWGRESMHLDVAQQEFEHLRTADGFNYKRVDTAPWVPTSRADVEALNAPLDLQGGVAQHTVTFYADQAHNVLSAHREKGAQSYRTLHGAHDKLWAKVWHVITFVQLTGGSGATQKTHQNHTAQ